MWRRDGRCARQHGATAAVAATCTRSGRAARRVRHLLSAIRYSRRSRLSLSSILFSPTIHSALSCSVYKTVRQIPRWTARCGHSGQPRRSKTTETQGHPLVHLLPVSAFAVLGRRTELTLHPPQQSSKGRGSQPSCCYPRRLGLPHSSSSPTVVLGGHFYSPHGQNSKVSATGILLIFVLRCSGQRFLASRSPCPSSVLRVDIAYHPDVRVHCSADSGARCCCRT